MRLCANLEDCSNVWLSTLIGIDSINVSVIVFGLDNRFLQTVFSLNKLLTKRQLHDQNCSIENMWGAEK
jgi:hypothetical protein